MRGCEDPHRCAAARIRRDAWLYNCTAERAHPLHLRTRRPARTRQLHGRACAPSAPADPKRGPPGGTRFWHQRVSAHSARTRFGAKIWCRKPAPFSGATFTNAQLTTPTHKARKLTGRAARNSKPERATGDFAHISARRRHIMLADIETTNWSDTCSLLYYLSCTLSGRSRTHLQGKGQARGSGSEECYALLCAAIC